MLVTAERITKQVTYVEREVPPPPKPPWKIHASIFAPRQRESDGKAFFDTEVGGGGGGGEGKGAAGRAVGSGRER